MEIKNFINSFFTDPLLHVRVKGENIRVKRPVSIKRKNGLVLGSNITIEKKCKIDATAGVLIGDSVVIDKNIEISTLKENGSYGPVIIGAGNKIEKDIVPGTFFPPRTPVNGLSAYSGQLLFVVSTGRSGSNAIAQLLNKHPEGLCYHDAFPHIYTYSLQKIYNSKPQKEILESLYNLYNSMNFLEGKLFAQSDQKLSPLIPELSILFPKAKFLWLIRDASEFINSALPRGWFANSEFGYDEPHPKAFLPKEVTPSKFDAFHRTNGHLCGVFNEDQWKQMTPFERNCWYWIYWNEMIEKNLLRLDKNRWMMVRLEDLKNKTDSIFDFVGLYPQRIEVKKTNTAKYKKPNTSNWTTEMMDIYQNWCKNGMEKWFGDYD